MAGVFKIRGAVNALLAQRAAASRRAADARVVTASGGNHGLGVATAARWLGIPATVYVPETVPDIKAARIAAAGADVVKTGRVYADAELAAREFAASQGLYYVHAYDDPAVVAGQGTVGLEIEADLPECEVVAVPVGGGGLLAGVSGALAAIDRAADVGRPGRRTGPPRVVGVEPEGCPTLHAAVEAGEPVDVGADSVAASALGAARIGGLALGRLPGQPGRPRARQRQGDPRRPRPPLGGVPAGGRARRRHRLRRLALRPGPRRTPLPRPVRRQRRLDPRLGSRVRGRTVACGRPRRGRRGRR